MVGGRGGGSSSQRVNTSSGLQMECLNDKLMKADSIAVFKFELEQQRKEKYSVVAGEEGGSETSCAELAPTGK